MKLKDLVVNAEYNCDRLYDEGESRLCKKGVDLLADQVFMAKKRGMGVELSAARLIRRKVRKHKR